MIAPAASQLKHQLQKAITEPETHIVPRFYIAAIHGARGSFSLLPLIVLLIACQQAIRREYCLLCMGVAKKVDAETRKSLGLGENDDLKAFCKEYEGSTFYVSMTMGVLSSNLSRRTTSFPAAENSQRALVSNRNNGLMSEGTKQRGMTQATLTPGFFIA